MPPPIPRDSRAARGILLVGPGPRAADLARVLAALGTAQGIEARSFADLADLALESGRTGTVLLDTDATPMEDVGYVRRFLVAHAGFELVLLGADSRSRTARVLGTRRFVHWPPDVEELTALVASARAVPEPSLPGLRPAALPTLEATDSSHTAPDDELELVRSILERESPSIVSSTTVSPTIVAPTIVAPRRESDDDERDLADDTAPVRREFADVFREDFDDRDGTPDENADDPRSHAKHEPRALFGDEEAATRATSGLDIPPWWRAQVADLADTSQRIDLSVRVLARAAPEIDQGDHEEAQKRLRELEAEVARLLQFTRTLGYVAAPPPTGTQVFDLGEMVHLFAANLAASSNDAPRCQFKTTPGAEVRSDRLLLNQALDAIFFLVRCTSKKGDLVRAQVQRTDDDGRAWIELALDFPSGPLEGFPEDELVAPYGLADLFPDLGPNALAAARGIVAGQGGRLSLASRTRGRMTWRLRLPRPGQ